MLQNKQNSNHYLFVEKYRPRSLETYIGNDHLKDKMKVYLESGDIPHLLLFGPAGTGKCLAFSENIDIEIELTDDEYQKLSKYSIEK